MGNQSILDYTDYRCYIRDIFINRLEKNPEYTLRKMSQELGFVSPGFISMLINTDHRMSSRNRAKLANGLCLKGDERTYLFLMTEMESARSEAEKVEIRGKMKQLKGAQSPLEYFVRDRACSLIASLSSSYGAEFSADPEWIYRHSKGEIDRQEIQTAVMFLFRHNFLPGIHGAEKMSPDEESNKQPVDAEAGVSGIPCQIRPAD